MTEKKYKDGFDGKRIAYSEWIADNPKGNVLIIHGVKEHSGRYARFASFLNKNGFNAFCMDNRAHGNTDTPGFTAEKDVFKSMIMDLNIWGEELKATGLPLIIFGHSFGSFLAQKLFNLLFADAYILSGSTYMRTKDTMIGKFIAGTAVVFGKGENTAKTVEKLSYGKFKKQFENGNWLSTSKPQPGLNLRVDELCGKPLNNNFYRSMFANTLKLYGADMGSANKNTPVLLISGSDDPVSKMGKGANRLYEEYKKRGFLVSLKLFEGLRHELINDPQHFIEVYRYVLEFMQISLKQAGHNID